MESHCSTLDASGQKWVPTTPKADVDAHECTGTQQKPKDLEKDMCQPQISTPIVPTANSCYVYLKNDKKAEKTAVKLTKTDGEASFTVMESHCSTLDASGQ